MPDYGWGQIPQAVGNVGIAAQNMAQMQQQGAVMRQQQQLNQININKAQMDLAEAQKREAHLNSGWDANTEPILAMLPDDKKAQYLNVMKTSGLVNAQGIGTQRNRQIAIDRLKSDFTLANDYAGVRLNLSRDKVAEAYDTLQKASEKGDPQKIADAQEAYKTSVNQHNIFAGQVDAGLKKVQVNQFFRENGELIAGLVRENPALALLFKQAKATDDPAQVQAVLAKVVEARAKAMEPVKLAQGETLTNPVTKEVIAQGAPKTPNEIELQMKANQGDKEARAVLDRIQADKVRVARESRPNNAENPRQMGKDAANLRKEFNSLQEIKDYNNIKTKYNSMVAALQESTTTKNFVATDQALITLFNKMTDPNSVVRESEYARTGVNMPFINMIKGKAEKVMTGGAGLTPEERTAIVRMGKLFMGTYQNNYQQRVNEYKGYAAQSGINPDMVIAPEVPQPKTKGQKPPLDSFWRQ